MNKDRCGTTTTTARSGCQTVKEIQTVQPFPTSGPIAENLGLPLPVLKSKIGKERGRAYSYVLSNVSSVLPTRCT